jgi:GTP-binding protein
MLKPPSLSPHRLYRAGSRISQQQQQKRCLQITSISQNSDSKGPLPARILFGDLKPADLAAYWDTEPPLQSDLEAAQRFFAPSRHSPVKLFSAAQFRTIPGDSKEPEVAFLGRSNVGKSSLINAILGEDICYASGTPGRTKIMNAFGIGGTKGGESKIVLLDMPGYGKASQNVQGLEIMKYLQKRKQCVPPCHY